MEEVEDLETQQGQEGQEGQEGQDTQKRSKTDHQSNSNSVWSGLTPLFKLAHGELKTLICATFFLLIATALNLTYPTLIGWVVDSINLGITNPSQSKVAQAQLNRWVLLLILLFSFMGLATFARSYLFTVAGERVVVRLRGDLFSHLLHQDQNLFDVTHSGQWVTRLADDTAKVQRAVTVNFSMLLRYLLGTLGALGILAWISLELTLVMTLIVPITIIAASIYGRALRRLSKRVQDGLAGAGEIAQEAISGIRTVQAFNGEPSEVSRYQTALHIAFKLAQRRAWLGGIFQGGISFVSYVAIAVVVWYGGRLTLAGVLSLGDLTAFMLYTFTLAFSVGALSGLWEDLSKALGATEVVFQLLARSSEMSGGVLTPPKCDGALCIQDVDFTYPARPDVQVLYRLNLTLKPSEMIALVGPSGGGKSTIAALLQRFYDPQFGQITLDNIPLPQLDLQWLRDRVGVVAQESFLFATSLIDNIRYGKPSATSEEVELAARSANAHEFILNFPEGYQTQIGERGLRLSGGQRQRIAIARAILKDPQILILDEATSALDAESEHLVQEALTRLMRGRTTLMIAHRLSTVRQADRIIVIERGGVVEEGSHEELMKRQGRYAMLVRQQISD